MEEIKLLDEGWQDVEKVQQDNQPQIELLQDDFQDVDVPTSFGILDMPKSDTSIVTDAMKATWAKKGPIGMTEYTMMMDSLSGVSGMSANIEHLPYFDIATLFEDGNILWKAQKLADNDYSEGEADLRQKHHKDVVDYYIKLEEMSYRGLSTGTKIYDAFGKSNAFMFEFISSLGIFPIAKKGTKELAKREIKTGLKDAIRGYAKSSIKNLGREIGRTATFMGPRVYSNYVERKINDELWVTDKGEVLMLEAKEAPALTAMKAFGDVLIENITETIGGGLIDDALVGFGKRLPKGFVDEFINGIPNETLKKTIKTGWGTLSRAERKIALDSIFAEYGEERMSALLKAFTGVDDRDIPFMDKVSQALFPEWEDALIELGVVGTMRGVSLSTMAIADKYRRSGMSDEAIQQNLSVMTETEKDAEFERMIERGDIAAPIEKINPEIDNLRGDISDLENQIESFDEKPFGSGEITSMTDGEILKEYDEFFENKRDLDLIDSGLKNHVTVETLDPNQIVASEWNSFGPVENKVNEFLKGDLINAPPVIVHRSNDGSLEVIDGIHRVTAAQQSGKNIESIVLNDTAYDGVLGGYSDALIEMLAYRHVVKNNVKKIGSKNNYVKMYHGTSSKEFSEFEGYTFLTDNQQEAQAFAEGVHLGGKQETDPRVLELYIPGKKIKDINDEVEIGMMEEGLSDKEILDVELKKANEEGYDAVTFKHPPAVGSEEFDVFVPTDNAKIISKEKYDSAVEENSGKVSLTKQLNLKKAKLQELVNNQVAEKTDLDKAPPSETTKTIQEDYNGEFHLPEETKWQAFRRTIEDYNIRLKILGQKIAEASGEQLKIYHDLWAQKDMLPRVIADRIRRINELKRNLVQKMVEADVKVEDVDEYLHALHAKERNAKMNEMRKEQGLEQVDGLSGMTDAEADAILSRDNSKLKPFMKFARELSENILSFELEQGLIKQEEYDSIKEIYDNYVPLYRDMESDVIGMGTGRGADVRGKEIKRAKGSKREVLSPLGNLFHQMERAQTRALKNEIGNTIMDLVEEYPFLAKMFEIKKQKYKPRFNSKGEMQYLEPEFQLADNVFGTKKDGTQYFITISDQRTAQALKNLNVARSNRFLNTLRGAIGIWSSFKTRWRPEFIITNFQRDLGEALLNLNVEKSMLGKEGKNLKRDVAKNVFKSQRKIWKYLRGKTDTAVDEFFKLGGDAGHFWAQDAMGSQESLLKLQKQLENQGVDKFLNPIKAAGQFIDDANSMIELGVRYSAYTELVKRGMNPKQAIQATTDMTINFQRKGEATSFLQSFYAFINPAIQGTSKVMRTMGTKQGKAKVLQGVTGLVALGFAVRVLSMLMDEDGDEQISDWSKNHKLTFAIGNGKTVTLWSMPYGYSSFYALGSNVAELAFGKKTWSEATNNILGTAANSFSPFGTDSNALIPTLYKPISEINANENWYGGPIYKEQIFTKTPKPDSQTYFKRTSETAKFIANIMNDLSGGDSEKEKAGFIDVSPNTLEYVYNQYLGGPFEFVTSSIEAGARGAQGEFDPNKTPFVRQFYRENKAVSWSYKIIYGTLENAYKKDLSEYEKNRFYRAVDIGYEEEVFDLDRKNNFIRDFIKAQYKIGTLKDDAKKIMEIPEKDRNRLMETYSERSRKTIEKYSD